MLAPRQFCLFFWKAFLVAKFYTKNTFPCYLAEFQLKIETFAKSPLELRTNMCLRRIWACVPLPHMLGTLICAYCWCFATEKWLLTWNSGRLADFRANEFDDLCSLWEPKVMIAVEKFPRLAWNVISVTIQSAYYRCLQILGEDCTKYVCFLQMTHF